MKNRRQLTPGSGGIPGAGGSAARTAFSGFVVRTPAAVPPRRGRGVRITNIGRAGRQGNLSS